MPYVGNPLDWSTQDKQGFIFAALREASADRAHEHAAKQCPICDDVYLTLKPKLGTDPLRFHRHPTDEERREGITGRIELPVGTKRGARLRHTIYEIHEHWVSEDWSVTAPKPAPTIVVEERQDVAPSVCQRDAEEVLRWVQKTMRPFGATRSADGKPFDQVGMRPALNGAKLLTEGLTPDAIKHALTLHYPPEARRALEVKPFDPSSFRPRDWAGVKRPANVASHDGRHKVAPIAKAIIAAGVPLMLVGEPGTGKTELARQLADDAGLPFGFVSMTAGTSPSTFNGRPRLAGDGTEALVAALIANGRTQEALDVAMGRASEGDTVASEFSKIFGGVPGEHDGGYWLFDELDAQEPSLGLLVNAALSNGFFQPASGPKVYKARNFAPIGAMNSLGLGGGTDLTGRSKQDAAVLDRWNAGRLETGLDEALESHLFWNTVAA